jgi:catechol 2,3-dioxygenase-like lactoylglutathione lyase family enzyme
MARPVFSGINHIGVVTGDIERAVRTWADRYGIGPWRFYTEDSSNMRAVCDGAPTRFAFRVALAQLSPTARVELIQPLDANGPYAQSLARNGGADHIHHVRFEVADYAASTATLRGELGLHTIMSAEFDAAPGNGSKFECAYFATGADLGFVAEIGCAGAGFAMPEPESVYPAEPPVDR